MAIARAECFYDTYVRSSDDNGTYEDNKYISIFNTGTGQPGFPGTTTTGVAQFSIPNLGEVVVNSAKLHFKLYKLGGFMNVVPVLFDWDTPLQGLTYKIFENSLDRKKEIVSDKPYECFGSGDVVDRWDEVDITNLVVGHLGKPNYTIGLYFEEVEGGKKSATFLYSKEAGFPMYIEIEYGYAPPFKPTIIYPNGDAVSNSGKVRFEWKYNSGGTSDQKKFDLWWKMQSAVDWNQITQISGNNYYEIDGTEFTNGIVEWQVRTYNDRDMVSEWATAQFVIIGKPANPVITGVKNDAITAITWQAKKSEESAARIRILKEGKEIYNSGVIAAGIEDIHKPNIILANGRYTALLSISNMYGMWSDEVSYSFDISNPLPAKPSLKVVGKGDHAELEFFSATEGCSYIVYRSEDGNEFIPIAFVEEKKYSDYLLKPEVRYQYFVRAYKKAYSDSDKKDISALYAGFFFSEIDSMDRKIHIILHDSEEYVPIKIARSNSNVLVSYYGRPKPVKESGVFSYLEVSLEFFLWEKDFKRLEDIYLKNGVFCLRGKNMLIFCDISGFDYETSFFNKGKLVGMRLKEIDHDQVVRFDEHG